ncbi:MAG TPA: BamA/TamA family outer membrane protein [Gemmatimonadaceae bacterium]|nr:BamA/TamA family outer membrane protein [Gemmatimonadaceae bacterium]
MLSASAGATEAAAQDLICDPGDVEVKGVEFDGNQRFRDADLSNAIATTPSSFLRRIGIPVGRRRCLDTLEFRRDIFRLAFFYRQRGYYKTKVEGATRPRGTGSVSVLFRINEGPPVLIDSLGIAGLDSLPNGQRFERVIRPLDGEVFNRLRVNALIDTVMSFLRNDGYARALDPLFNYTVDTTRNRAVVDLTFVPGSRWRIGQINIQVEPVDSGDRVQIPPSTVKNLLTFRERDVYRERELLQSQRTLYQTEAYRLVQIQLAPDSLQPNNHDSLRVLVDLAESQMHSVRLGAGWATLDCFRTQGRFTHRNFLGGARRLELTARLSKIGIGEPLDGAEGLCRPIRDDPFSERMNYYGSVNLRPPTFFGPRNTPSFTLYSERRSEFKAYLREVSVGGLASVTREVQPRTPFTLSYQFEYGRTQAEDAIFCSIFNVCTLEDITRLQERNELHAVSLTTLRDRTNNPFDPSHGSHLRTDIRWVSSNIGEGGAVRFNKAFGEFSVYRRFIGSSVFAARLQLGGIFNSTSFDAATVFVPPQERLYGGGPNSVRGFAQNQLGPLVYVFQEQDREAIDSIIVAGEKRYFVDPDATPSRISPTGGNTLVTGTAELRWRGPFLRELVQWAAFVDAGQVWNRPAQGSSLSDLRITPGAGVRVGSPVGPLRLDVAYNRYAARAGAAYFVGRLSDTPDSPRRLLCVSPGNTLPNGQAVGSESCPETFAPDRNDSFLSRLTLHFSIGQAF